MWQVRGRIFVKKKTKKAKEAEKKNLLLKIEERKQRRQRFYTKNTTPVMRFVMFLIAASVGYVGISSLHSTSSKGPSSFQESSPSASLDTLMRDLLKARRFKEASQIGKDLYEDTPSPALAYTLGEIHQMLGEFKKARFYFEIALNAHFREADVKHHLGEIKKERKEVRREIR